MGMLVGFGVMVVLEQVVVEEALEVAERTQLDMMGLHLHQLMVALAEQLVVLGTE
jgi:hypothetical protein